MGYNLKDYQNSPDGLDREGRNKVIVNRPGDEGSCPQDEDSQGESHPSDVPEFQTGKSNSDDSQLQARIRQTMNKPGDEGSYPLGHNADNRQGNRDVPPAPVPGEFLKGEDVRKTRVMPKNGDDTPAMPGA